MVASASAPTSLPDAGRYVSLDSWRGIAALGVTAFHIHGGGAVFESRFVRSGGTWVDFFFVLSGFVIAASYGSRLQDGFPISRFAMLRLGRIWPLHACVVAFYIAVELARWLAPGGALAGREVFDEAHSPAMLVATMLLVQTWLPWSQAGWNLPSWSISVELLLYLLIAGVWRWAGPRGWQVALAAAVAAGAVLMVREALPLNVWLMARGVTGFGLGVVCFRWRALGLAAGGTLAELACVAAVVAIFSTALIERLPLVAIDLVFAVLIAVYAAERGALSGLLRRRPFVFLGTVSYSLYLTHIPVIGRELDLLRQFGLSGLTQMPEGLQHRILASAPWDGLIGLGVVAACLPIAWLSWRLIEVPSRDWSRRRAARLGAGHAEAQAPTI